MPDRMALEMGMVTGAVLAGRVSGLIPVASACRRRRIVPGVVGLLLCIGMGFMGGFILTLPFAILLGWAFNFLPKGGYQQPTLSEAGGFINPYANGRRSAFDNHLENAMPAAAPTESPAGQWT